MHPRGSMLKIAGYCLDAPRKGDFSRYTFDWNAPNDGSVQVHQVNGGTGSCIPIIIG